MKKTEQNIDVLSEANKEVAEQIESAKSYRELRQQGEKHPCNEIKK